MALTSCYKCGGQVSSAAPNCPHCGSSQTASIKCAECDGDVRSDEEACKSCGFPNASFSNKPDFRKQFPHPGPMGNIPSIGLNRKFVAMGTLAGRSFHEISMVVGLPSATSHPSPGLILRQWLRPGFHIALIFDDNEICGGITHQSG